MRFAILPLLLVCPFFLQADDHIELPSNLSPKLKARLLAQNTAQQAEPAPEVPAPPENNGAAPADITAPAVPAAPQQGQVTPLPNAPAQPGAVVPPATPLPGNGAVVPPPPPNSNNNAGPGGGFNRRGPGAGRQGGPGRGNIPLPGRSPSPGATPQGGPAPAPAPTDAPEDPNNFLLAFTGSPIEDVIDEYQRISGHHVIRDPGLTGTVVVVQNPNVKMTRDEGIDFIKASLLLQGYSIQEYTKGIDKIVSLAKPPSLEPPLDGSPIYMKVEDLPNTDKPVNFLIRLDYLSAKDAADVFVLALPNHAWGRYVAATSNTLLIQETVPNIRSLIRIKEQVDVEPVKQVHEWVELERASAEDVQALMDGILQAQTQATTGGGGGGGIRPVGLPGGQQNIGGQPGVAAAAAGPNTASGLMPDGKSVIVKADPRTNRIFIHGPKVHVEYLKKLVKEFDQASKVKNLLTQQLRYIPVDDFLDIAVASLQARGAGDAGQGGGGGGGATGQGSTRSTAGQNQTGGNRGGFGQSQFGGGGGFGGGGFGGGGFGGTSSTNRTGTGASRTSGGASTQSTAPLPRSQVVGKTLLISDPRMNSLLVTGPPESILRISELVKEMDRRPLQVHINAVIAQVILGDDITTGMDLLRKVDTVNIGGESVSFGGLYKTTGGGTFLDPANLDTIGGFTSALDGLNLYGSIGELFNAYVRALEATSRFKILSKPHVATANNETAAISVGSRVPYPGQQQSSVVSGGTTAVTSNVEYQDVDLILEVTPLINSKNEITIVTNQQNNTVGATKVINGNEVPTIQTQSLNNKITVPNGAICTIGGGITESKDIAVTGLPFVSKIPVIKHLFGTTKHSTKRQELLIMIQPRIIDTADDMVEVHTSEVQRTIIGPDAENFTKPERDTTNLQLPTYEKNIPYESAGYPQGTPTAPKGFFRRLGAAFKTR